MTPKPKETCQRTCRGTQSCSIRETSPWDFSAMTLIPMGIPIGTIKWLRIMLQCNRQYRVPWLACWQVGKKPKSHQAIYNWGPNPLNAILVPLHQISASALYLQYYFTILIRKLFPKDIPALWFLNIPQVFCFLDPKRFVHISNIAHSLENMIGCICALSLSTFGKMNAFNPLRFTFHQKN